MTVKQVHLLAAGLYDDQISMFIDGLQSLAVPAYVRIGYEFNGKNLASGVYFYRLTAGSSVQTRKLCLLR